MQDSSRYNALPFIAQRKIISNMERFRDLPFPTMAHIILLFVSFVNSMYPWFVWNNNFDAFITFFSCLAALYNCYYYKLFRIAAPIFFFTLMCAMFLWGNRDSSLFGFLFNVLFLIINLVTVVLYDSNIKKIALRFITNGMAFLTLFSLSCYILYLLGLYPVVPSYIEVTNGAIYRAYNYYAFLQPLLDVDFDWYGRFYGIFAEPGHMAMGLTLLIAANRFNFAKFPVFVLLIGNLFSFSLAGYIITFVGICLYNISLSKFHNFIIVLIVTLAGLGGLLYSGNENLLDVYLWNRIHFSGDGSLYINNNRTTYSYDMEFEKIVNNPRTLILGSDEPVNSSGNAGYKVFVVRNGLLGIFLVFCFFVWFPIKYKRKDNLFYFVILSLFLMQGFYPYRTCVLLSYILSLQEKNKDEIKLLCHK